MYVRLTFVCPHPQKNTKLCEFIFLLIIAPVLYKETHLCVWYLHIYSLEYKLNEEITFHGNA